MKPRPYQLEACNAVVAEWAKGKRSTMLVLPTGCGKTVIFAGIIFWCEGQGKKVLVLAHQKNLIDQAADKIENMFGLKTFREKGKNDCRKDDGHIVVSCYQTICRRLKRYPSDFFDYIVIDECHHSWAKGYQSILSHFDKANVLGVTATPYRSDGKSLDDIYQSTAYTYTIEQAQAEGFLAPSIVVEPSEEFTIDFSAVKIQNGDYEQNALAQAIEPYLQIIAEDMRKNEDIRNRKIVIFVPLIVTAQKAAEVFSHYGFRTMWTSGVDKEKDQKLAEFNTWQKGVICSSLLLTEGWDCPSVDCVVVLRPTTSQALYTQMIGRGLRLSEGKENCIIYDVLGLHDFMGVPKPPKQKANEGEDKEPETFEEALEELEEELIKKPVDRYASLKRKMEEAAEWRKQKKVCQRELERNIRLTETKCVRDHQKNPFEICPNLCGTSEYRIFASDGDPYKLTKNQKDFLARRGICFDFLNWKQVSTLIGYLKDNELATAHQKYRLLQMGFTQEEAGSMKMSQATRILNAYFGSEGTLHRSDFEERNGLWTQTSYHWESI